MALAAIYLILIFGYAIVLLGFILKEYLIAILGCFSLYLSGVYIIQNGLDGFSNFAVDAFAIVTLAFAMYVSIVGAMQYINS